MGLLNTCPKAVLVVKLIVRIVGVRRSRAKFALADVGIVVGDVEAWRVGDVEDVERVTCGKAFAEVSNLLDRNIGVSLEGLTEDVALPRREVVLKDVAGLVADTVRNPFLAGSEIRHL